jgi:threonine/homoserine/homoserine lactone efflux protein
VAHRPRAGGDCVAVPACQLLFRLCPNNERIRAARQVRHRIDEEHGDDPLESWLAFAAASAVLLVIPGPTILTVISYSLTHGRRAAIPLVTAVALGDSTALAFSLLGLGSVLAASAMAFSVVKVAGGAYLIYLGIKMIRTGLAKGTTGSAAAPSGVSRRRLFLNTYGNHGD